MYWLLKQEGFDEPEEIAREVETAFEQCPHWRISPQQERDMKWALVRILVNERAKAESEKRAVKDTNADFRVSQTNTAGCRTRR